MEVETYLHTSVRFAPHGATPTPLGNHGIGRSYPLTDRQQKNYPEVGVPKKYASKKIIPSKNIKQISKKVLTIMKTYGKIEM